MAEVSSIFLVKGFLEECVLLNQPLICAVDPGVSGAMGFLCGNKALAIDIPTIEVMTGRKTKKGNKAITTLYNDAMLADLLVTIAAFWTSRPSGSPPASPAVHFVVERGQVGGRGFGGRKFGKGTHAGEPYRDTPNTAYQIGWATGMWPLAFSILRVYHDAIPAPELITPMKWKKAMGLTGKDKEYARAQALKHWPRADLQRKKDHNRAEALLLALYYQQEKLEQ